MAWTNIKVHQTNARILQGNISQAEVDSAVAGTQCTACAVAFLARNQLKPLRQWDAATVDSVILEGTQLHEKCQIKDKYGFADVGSFVGVRKICNNTAKLSITETHMKNAIASTVNLPSIQAELASEVIQTWISQRRSCVIVLNDFALGLLVDDLAVYLFNPHDCNSFGERCDQGKACVIEFQPQDGAVIESLISRNYGPSKTSRNVMNAFYSIYAMEVKLQLEEPPKAAYEPSDNDFDFDKSKKLPKNLGSEGNDVANRSDPSKPQEVQKCGVPIYKIAALPAEYKNIQKFIGTVDVERVRTRQINKTDIRNNAVILYSAKAMEDIDTYWRRDGLSWGGGTSQKLPRSAPRYKVFYYKLLTKVPGVNYTRKEIVPLVEQGDEYDWIGLKNHKWPYILVHYSGTGDLTNLKRLPHGNRVHTPKKKPHRKAQELALGDKTTPKTPADSKLPPHEAKPKSQLDAVKRKILSGGTGYQGFASMRANAKFLEGKDAEEMTPRNVGQFYSAKRNLKKESELEDPVGLLVYHSIFHKEYMPVYSRLTGILYAVAKMPEMDAHFRQILASTKNISLHYDTTFDCGPYFVSILLFRHPFLRNHPIIPLRFFFHEDKAGAGHEMLFRNLKEDFPQLNSKNVTFVSDREASFKKNLKKYFPLMTHMFCYLHINTNVSEWCKSHGKRAKIWQLTHDVKLLLFAESEDDFDEQFRNLSENWPVDFLQYFEKCLKADVRASARYNAEKRGVFDRKSGVTNNYSESANAAFKTWLATRRSMYEAVLRAYFYQVAKLDDIQDAWNFKDSKFKLDTSLSPPQIQFADLKDVISELGLNSIFNEGKYSNRVINYTPEYADIKSTRGLARYFVQEGCIKYLEKHCFVFGLMGDVFHVDPNRRRCTCLAPECAHLVAVSMQQGRKLPQKSEKLNLTKATAKLRPLPQAGRKLSNPARRRFRLGLSRPEILKTIARAKQTLQKREILALVSRENRRTCTPQHSSSVASPQLSPLVAPVEGGAEASVDAGLHDDEVIDSTPQSTSVETVSMLQISEFRLLPPLSLTNSGMILLRLPNHQVRLWDVKTLAPALQRSEWAAMRQKNKQFETGFTNDNIVDAFFSRISTAEVFAVCTQWSTLLAKPYKKKTHEVALRNLKSRNWEDVKTILLPFHSTAFQHWKLAVFRIQAEEIHLTVLDPLRSCKEDVIALKSLQKAFSCILEKLNRPCTIQNDEAYSYLPKQDDSSSCGPHICWYGYHLATGINMPSRFSNDWLRNFVLKTIRGKCGVLKEHQAVCVVCGKSEDESLSQDNWVACDICKVWWHYACLNLPPNTDFTDKSFCCGDFPKHSSSN